jgi:hypothetical protein
LGGLETLRRQAASYLASHTTLAIRALNHPKQGTYRCPGAAKVGGGGR